MKVLTPLIVILAATEGDRVTARQRHDATRQRRTFRKISSAAPSHAASVGELTQGHHEVVLLMVAALHHYSHKAERFELGQRLRFASHDSELDTVR